MSNACDELVVFIQYRESGLQLRHVNNSISHSKSAGARKKLLPESPFEFPSRVVDLDSPVASVRNIKLRAAGLGKRELEQRLAAKFQGEYLRDPKVTVDVADFRPFYILGEITKPGEYPYKGGLDVMSAIALAGGSTYRASRSAVMIKHSDESQFREYPLSPAIPVLPGDLIRLPERYF